MKQTLAVQVRLATLHTMPDGSERAVPLDAQSSAPVLVTPSRFLLAPRVERWVQVSNRWPVHQPANYELRFETVVLGASGATQHVAPLDIGFAAAPGVVRIHVVPVAGDAASQPTPVATDTPAESLR